MSKDLPYYLNLPYTRELIPEPEGGWFVRVKELPGCMSQGETPDEAMRAITDAMQGWLEVELERGALIPEPRTEEAFSGKFIVRTPKSLHREISAAAEAEGVSLNQWVNVSLAKAVSQEQVATQKRVMSLNPSGHKAQTDAEISDRVKPGTLARSGKSMPRKTQRSVEKSPQRG